MEEERTPMDNCGGEEENTAVRQSGETAERSETANAAGTAGAGDLAAAESAVRVPVVTSSEKERIPKRLVALCIVCALLGSIIGGTATGFVMRGGASSEGETAQTSETAAQTQTVAQPQPGEDNSVLSGTVTSSEDKPSEDKVYTAQEIYKNNVESVVSIICKGNYGTGYGTGFIINEQGYIVTNYHVVDGAVSVSVALYDESVYTAEIIGYEETNDIAVIKIEPQGEIHSLVYGTSSQLEVGDPIYIIGNPLGDLTFTLTNGVVSALNRLIDVGDGISINMFQTNAAVNSGNSGGPAFDEHGYVVGIASAKYASSSIEGLSFCIPIDDVRSMIDEIINKGYVSGKPYLGVSVYDREVESFGFIQSTRTISGAKIAAVGSGTPAAAAGLAQGDVIVEAAGTSVTSVSALRTVLTGYRSGDILTLTVSRNGTKHTVSVVLGEYEPSEPRYDSSYIYDL